MGVKIKNAELISQLTAGLMLPVGNTSDENNPSAINLTGLKNFMDADKATVAVTGSYTDLTDKPNLNDYALVSTLNGNYYNKMEIDNLIGGVSGISFEIVSSLPQTGSPSVIYLVYNDEYDRYDEYVWSNDEWVNIGNTNIDLSNYYTKSQVDNLIPTVNNSTITIQQNGVTAGTFTLNQSSDATISLTGGGGGCDCPQADWDQSDSAAEDYIKNKPVIPTVNNPEILFCVNGDVIDSITLNQSNSKAIDFESFTQVQSDWNQSDDTLPSFIKNKPSIPQVNNPTIHFTQGGVDKGSITLNQSSGATIALDAGGGGGGVQSDWNETNSASMAYIQNKPTISDATVSFSIDGDVVGSFSLNQGSNASIDLGGATQVQSDWDEADTSSMAYIQNKPTLAAVATSGDYNDLSNTPSFVQQQADWNQSNSSAVDYIKNKPTIPDAVSGTNDGTNWTTITIGSTTKAIPSGGGAAQVQSDWSQSDNTQVDYIKNKPSLATVATSGSYADLSNTPTISDATISFSIDGTIVDSMTLNQSSAKTIDLGSAVQVQSDWDEVDTSSMAYILNKPSLATVATSGSYADLSNTPTIPDAVSGVNDGTSWTSLTIGSTTKAIPSSSDFVTVSTDQTITGTKTFSHPVLTTTTDYDGRFTIKLNSLTIGTNPSSNCFVGFKSADSQGSEFANVNCGYSTTGKINSNFYVNNQNGVHGSLGIYIDNGGTTAYTSAPTPASNDNSTKIATTAFVKAQGYATSSSLATVATSGSYADLSNKPTIPSNTRTLVVTYEDTTTENITVYTT